MISSEAPLLFAKAAQIFITEVQFREIELCFNCHTVDTARVDPYGGFEEAYAAA